jgi:hypothetical protein
LSLPLPAADVTERQTTLHGQRTYGYDTYDYIGKRVAKLFDTALLFENAVEIIRGAVFAEKSAGGGNVLQVIW